MRGERTGEHVLPQRVALRLAAVLAQHVSSSAGVRSLVVKGEGLDRQGLRSPRTSADVDLWVDPDRFDTALAALRAVGWSRRPEALSWTLFVDHSVTLVHPQWPCDLDVHRSFPGALAPEGIVFEEIWESRIPLQYDLVSVSVPDRSHHVVIHALHHLRSGRESESRAAVARLGVLVGSWSRAEREAVRDAAVAVGAQGPLESLLSRWGVPSPVDPGHLSALSLWQVRCRSDRHTFNWLHAIVTAPWRLKGLLIVRAVFPTRADLEASHPSLAERPAPLERVRVRVERALRGLRRMPSALADVRAVARSGRPDPRAPLDAASFPPSASAEQPAGAPMRRETAPPSPGENRGVRPSGSGFVVEREGDEVYVLDLERPASPPVVLSTSGYEIWSRALLLGESSDRIVRELSAAFGVAPHLMEKDVESFLVDLGGYFPASRERPLGGTR